MTDELVLRSSLIGSVEEVDVGRAGQRDLRLQGGLEPAALLDARLLEVLLVFLLVLHLGRPRLVGRAPALPGVLEHEGPLALDRVDGVGLLDEPGAAGDGHAVLVLELQPVPVGGEEVREPAEDAAVEEQEEVVEAELEEDAAGEEEAGGAGGRDLGDLAQLEDLLVEPPDEDGLVGDVGGGLEGARGVDGEGDVPAGHGKADDGAREVGDHQARDDRVSEVEHRGIILGIEIDIKVGLTKLNVLILCENMLKM